MDKLQNVDLPVEQIIGCQLPSIKKLHDTVGVKKRDRMIYSQASILRQLFISKTFPYRWCQCILMKTTCHLNSFFPELSEHSETLPQPTVSISGDTACNPDTVAVYLLLSNLIHYFSQPQHIYYTMKKMGRCISNKTFCSRSHIIL